MKKLIFLGAILMHFISNGQTNEFLPLSRYGYGTLTRIYSPLSQSCGHAGIAYANEEEFNILNPASLGFLKITDAEIGFSVKNKKITTGDNSVSDLSGTLSYLQIGVPLRNSINEILERKEHKHNFGVSLGIQPYSSTSYNYEVKDSTAEGNLLRRLNGSGGLNQIIGGFGYRIGSFACGLNLGYIFGNLKFNQNFYLTDVYPAANDNYSDQFFGSGFNSQLGVLYEHVLNKNKIKSDKAVKPRKITYSFLLGMPVRLNMSRYALHTSRIDLGLSGSVIDTLLYLDDNLSNGELPLKLSTGISYNHKNTFGFLADFVFENWDSADPYEGSKGNLTNNTSVAFGTWYRPDYSGYGNVLKKSQYRLGFFHEKGYLTIDDESLRNYGLTIGMAMPFVFQRQLCVVNLGLEFGKSELKDIISEEYFKVNIGIRINDSEWFLKRRYN